MVYNEQEYLFLLEYKLHLGLKRSSLVAKHISVKKRIFPILGARIWAPILVYPRENPCVRHYRIRCLFL